MVVSRTPLFVLFDLGSPADRHKPAVKIATMPFPTAANGKNSFEDAFRTGWYFRRSRGRHRPRAAHYNLALPIPSAATPSPIGAMREARICPHLQAA
jgi:hypothetical protein